MKSLLPTPTANKETISSNLRAQAGLCSLQCPTPRYTEDFPSYHIDMTRLPREAVIAQYEQHYDQPKADRISSLQQRPTEPPVTHLGRVSIAYHNLSEPSTWSVTTARRPDDVPPAPLSTAFLYSISAPTWTSSGDHVTDHKPLEPDKAEDESAAKVPTHDVSPFYLTSLLVRGAPLLHEL